MSNLAVANVNPLLHNLEIFIASQNSLNTKTAYRRDVQDFLNEITSRGLSSDPNYWDLATFVAYQQILLSKGLSNSTVNRKMATLKSMMAYFYLHGGVKTNPIASLKTVRASIQTPTQALTDVEVKQVIAQANTDKQRTILYFLFYLGLRRSELCNIKLGDVYKTGKHTVLNVKGKGGKTREIPLTNELEKMYEDCKTSASTDSVFNITPDGVYKLVKRSVKKAGIDKRISPHSCRATVISHLLENGESPRDVADFAGHANVNTTINSYDKKRDGLNNSAAYKVGF